MATAPEPTPSAEPASDRAALRAAYDRYAETYGSTRNAIFDAFRDEVLDWFATATRPVGSRVLDLGSGPGRESVQLRERGLAPLAIDFALAMARQCRQRGVATAVMDLYHLGLPAEQFAGAWVSFSLLHMPKQDVLGILDAVHRVLVPGGTIVVLLFEGAGEGPRQQDVRRFGTARYFSYYQPDELRETVGARFSVTAQWRLDISPRPTLGVAGRKTTEGQRWTQHSTN